MVWPTITPLPTAPRRGDAPATFSSNANAWVAAMGTFTTQVNAAGGYIDTQVLAAETAKTDAETAEAGAQAAEANTLLLEASVIATANFKGNWSDLVGALAKPASVAHDGVVWLLLNNLADVTTSEPAAGNTDWQIAVAPPTSASISVAVGANGVTAGNVVELVSDGVQDLQNIYHCEAPTISSLVTLDGTNDVSYLSLSTLGDGSNALAVWYDGTTGFGQIGKITAGSPPTLSGVIATSTNLDRYLTSCPLGVDTAAVTFLRSTAFHTAVASVSGTNITLSTTATNASAANITPATCALTTSNWLVAYADTNSDCQILTAVSNATNAPTLGTALNVNSTNNANYLSLARTSDTTAMLVLQNTSDSNGEIAHITGGTTNAPTASTLAHLDGTNNCTYLTQSPIDSNHTLCAYRNAASAGSLAVIQANGTNAPTVIARSDFSLTSATFISLTGHSSNIHSLAYTDASGLGQHLAVYVDSNYAITMSQKNPLNGSTNCAYNAVAALTDTTAIGAWQEGAGSDGKAATLTLTPTPVISGQLLGISQDTATNGTATIDLGPVWSTTNTLTLGEEYFANPNGGLTTNATPVFVGTADTTSSLVLDLSGNPAVGLEQVWEITTPGAFTFTVPESGEYEIVICGGGGSGAVATHGSSGNGGNTIILRKEILAGAGFSGSVGTGGAGVTNATAVTGGSTTLTLFGVTYTAKGGRGGSDGDVNSKVINNQNDMGEFNLPGTSGQTTSYFVKGGVSLLTLSPASGVGTAGSRGGGGCANTSGTSGKGGDGVVRITLKRGT